MVSIIQRFSVNLLVCFRPRSVCTFREALCKLSLSNILHHNSCISSQRSDLVIACDVCQRTYSFWHCFLKAPASSFTCFLLTCLTLDCQRASHILEASYQTGFQFYLEKSKFVLLRINPGSCWNFPLNLLSQFPVPIWFLLRNRNCYNCKMWSVGKSVLYSGSTSDASFHHFSLFFMQ